MIILVNMKYHDQFKHHKFLSVNQTRESPHKEWIGETANDEVVVVKYENGELYIGAGWNEIKARADLKNVAITKNQNGEIRIDKDLTLTKINEDIKLEWVLPDGFVDE